ncbi:MAG: hypothetical protein ACXVAX_03595 [Pseudobdellovibrio sp.]
MKLSAGSENLKKIWTRHIHFVLLAVLFFFLIYQYDLTWFNTHMARDFFRAQELLQFKNIPWLGPEIGWDYKRLPGPLYYFFLSFLLLFKSTFMLFALKAFFIVLSIYSLIRELRKKYAEYVPSFSLLFLLTPFFIFTSRNFWNPSLVVALNCLQLALFLRLDRTSSKRNLFYLFLTALSALQVHFSTLLIYISISLTILLTSRFDKSFKKIQGGLLGVLGLFLLAWYRLNYIPKFDEQIDNLIGLNHYFIQRFFDLLSFISLSFIEIKDYDLFTVLTRGMAELDMFNYKLYMYTSVVISFILSGLLVWCAVKLKNKPQANRSILNTLFLIHLGLFVITILLVKNKDHVPYRYGLCLLPFPFLFLSLNVPHLFKRAKRYFLIFSGLVFLFYFSFNMKMIEAQEVLGRSHHTNLDNLELNLRNKLEIYKNYAADTSHADPFNNLHGRTANKFRLKEMNWEQNIPYYSIFKLVTPREINLNPLISDEPVAAAKLLQLKNINHLRDDITTAYKISDLNPAFDLPQFLSIGYYDSQNNLLLQKDWKNTNLILPFAFIDPKLPIDHIKVNFKIERSSPTVSFLSVLLDGNREYKFAYPTIYSAPQLKINNTQADYSKLYRGNFLVQSQYVYKLTGLHNEIELNLKVLKFYQNYSRLDLFVTTELPWQEELF